MFCYLKIPQHVFLEVSLQYKHIFNKIVIHIHVQLVSVSLYRHLFYEYEGSTPYQYWYPILVISIGVSLGLGNLKKTTWWCCVKTFLFFLTRTSKATPASHFVVAWQLTCLDATKHLLCCMAFNGSNWNSFTILLLVDKYFAPQLSLETRVHK